jgi:hypothetical protein
MGPEKERFLKLGAVPYGGLKPAEKQLGTAISHMPP